MGLQLVACQILLLSPWSHLQIVYILYKFHNNLGGLIYQLLLFFHMQPTNQPTIIGVALCHKEVGDPCFSMYICYSLIILFLQVLMVPMVISILYVWCQLNKDVIVNFWFGSQFKAMYLPWVLCAFNFIIAGG
jgi:hypothetical protein